MPYPSLAANTQPLTTRLAAHLLRRSTYNYDIDRIIQFTGLAADVAVEQMFNFGAMKYPDGPLNWNNSSTPAIFNLSDTSDIGVVDNDIGRSAIMWRTFEALYDKSIRWKLLHWLHTIFPVRVNSYFYHYWRLLDACIESDLKTIAIKITTDSCMMTYLDNLSNTVSGPNENFAREVLELMTIRKGESAGLGNYTYYTETDIANAAKVLSGYSLLNSTYKAPIDSIFNIPLYTDIVSAEPNPLDHDFSSKVFSEQLTGSVEEFIPEVTASSDQTPEQMYVELDQFYGLVYGNMETAKSFVRRMYQFFVRDEIDDATETAIIGPLADDLKAQNYDHIFVLKKLLKSNHFYDLDDQENKNEIIGGKIKSPWELLFQSINLLNIPELPGDSQEAVELLFRNYFKIITEEHLRFLGLNQRGPDTVEGYTGFYQEPKFSKNWFSSANVYKRYSIGESFKGNYVFESDSAIFNQAFPFIVDLFEFVHQFETLDNSGNPVPGPNPFEALGVANAGILVTQMISYFLPDTIDYIDDSASDPWSLERYKYFEDSLLGGLSPINWYYSWKGYLESDPNDADYNDVTNNVKVGLERLFDAIISSPEFQTF